MRDLSVCEGYKITLRTPSVKLAISTYKSQIPSFTNLNYQNISTCTDLDFLGGLILGHSADPQLPVVDGVHNADLLARSDFVLVQVLDRFLRVARFYTNSTGLVKIWSPWPHPESRSEGKNIRGSTPRSPSSISIRKWCRPFFRLTEKRREMNWGNERRETDSNEHEGCCY